MFDMSRITPCKNCTKRHIACHSKCKEYIAWKAEWDKLKEHERKENLLWRDKRRYRK